MSIPYIDPRIALVGLVVGLLTGLSGVGGGSLVTPLLVLALGVKPLVAVGTDLMYSVPTKLLGAVVHHRQGTVNWRLTRYLVYGGVPASIVALIALSFVEAHIKMSDLSGALKHSLGLMLILVSAAIIIKPLLARWTKQTTKEDSVGLDWTPGEIGRIVALGAVVGFLVSLTSIGSGALTVPLLFILLPQLGLKKLVGTDVAFAAILIPVATLGHLQMGHVDMGLALSLTVGSLPGVYVGSKLCARFPDVWLRPALAGVLLFAGTKLV